MQQDDKIILEKWYGIPENDQRVNDIVTDFTAEEEVQQAPVSK